MTQNRVPVCIAVLTVSDTRDEATDKSGKLLVGRLEAAGHVLHEKQIPPDDIYQLRAQVSQWIAEPRVQAIVTTGGTGLTGRDGPPGARYNTLPGLKPLPAQILDGYWREGNVGDWARYRSSRENGSGPAGFARAQAAVFHRNLDCLRRERKGCALQ